MTAAEVRTTCPYCGVGCGIVARIEEGAVRVRGDPLHPANRGALCSKGSALGETTGLDGRLLRPRVFGEETGWDAALDEVALRFRRAVAGHGPDSVAFYVSGQLLTEDYYVANKLMKGFIGSANIDTNSRLCMASAVAAHKRAFGEDLVPTSYEDLDLADLIVLVGSNTAWCHPVIYRRILEAKERRPSLRLVVIDPRRTPTCDLADLHLPLRAGTDVLLFNGLLSWLAAHGAADRGFLDRHTRNSARTLLVAENTAGDAGVAARGCGLDAEALRLFYRWFADTERVVTLFSQGVNQSCAGTDKANSIINVHLLTGRIGRPGMGPFSMTGQPNAMGGREVGGLSNSLAAHMEIEDAGHRRLVREFWNAPRMAERPGLKAVELFEAVHQGRIKALWIMATNPVVSLPNADRAREALRRCDFVVLSDVVSRTDTAALAHVLLPAAAWGEKEGTVTNSDRHISRQRRFLPAAGEAKPDWWIICRVAERMGFDHGFGYRGPAEIFDEHARLSAVGNASSRAFDIGGLKSLGETGYALLEPVQWPVPGADRRGTERLFADARFYHPDGRARLVPTIPRPPKFALDDEYPLILNTGRIRDQWHSMTRTGRSPSLSSHFPEPFVDMHDKDARQFGVRNGALVNIITRWGRMTARLRISGETARGTLFAPIHWSDSTSSSARVGALVSPSVDPLSGEPEFKTTPARIEPCVVNWYGFVFSRDPVMLEGLSYWACAESGAFRRYEIAGRRVPAHWPGWARSLLRGDPRTDWIDYQDVHAGTYRAARLADGRLEGCLFVGPRPELPSRSWPASLFDRASLTSDERLSLLASRPSAQDSGPLVCACFGVGRKAIESAIGEGAGDVQSIGRRSKAGTNCGSCLPEIRRILAEVIATSP